MLDTLLYNHDYKPSVVDLILAGWGVRNGVNDGRIIEQIKNPSTNRMKPEAKRGLRLACHGVQMVSNDNLGNKMQGDGRWLIVSIFPGTAQPS